MLFEKTLKDSDFHEKETDQSLHFWSNLDHQFLPKDDQNRKDIISGGEKFDYWTIQICQNEGLTSSPL